MTLFKTLAEIISERQFFEIEEVESLIQTYFEFYRQDVLNDELSNNDIVRRRNAILAKKRDLQVARDVIEKQLLVAKSRLKEGKTVDTEWMARANLAFRIKNRQIVSLDNDLTNLKTYERSENIKRTNTEDRMVRNEVLALLRQEIGDEDAIAMFQKAESNVRNKRNNPCLNQ